MRRETQLEFLGDSEVEELLKKRVGAARVEGVEGVKSFSKILKVSNPIEGMIRWN